MLDPEQLDLEILKRDIGKLPQVNVSEGDNLFKIDVSAPGLRREDISVEANGNTLTIKVLQKDDVNAKEENYRLREFENQCFVRHIMLPEGIDPEFSIAEYIRGVLHIYLPKTERPSSYPPVRIVVY
ncbi:MAG TPA: Hsp20/alpha crystallin family protein [Chitinophagaceae bacterium]|nr:Hsp20/alpha crystallin family protein [Chitinophagaceae bacterium]